MDSLDAVVGEVFRYPDKAFVRRHGPLGYVDPASFKPWLRDDFSFRCLYCLTREVWRPDGHDSFSIEHIHPRVSSPSAICDYENLAYACVACNSRRQNQTLPFDPCEVALGDHLKLEKSGRLQPLSDDAAYLIDLCRLNRSSLVNYRGRLVELLEILRRSEEPGAREALASFLRYPDDLPDLARLRPPGGNSKPEGVSSSYFARRASGELSDFS